MVSEKDKEIISHLRGNSREKITSLAKKVGLPATTLYSKLKSYEKGLIKKHTSLVDFSQLGYYKNVYLVLRVKGKREELKEFLSHHPSINSLFRINYNHDFLAEGIFRDEKEVTKFLDELEGFGAEAEMLNVVEEIKKEGFLEEIKKEEF